MPDNYAWSYLTTTSQRRRSDISDIVAEALPAIQQGLANIEASLDENIPTVNGLITNLESQPEIKLDFSRQQPSFRGRR